MKKLIKTASGIAVGGALTLGLLWWTGGDDLNQTGRIVEELAQRVHDLQDQLFGTDEDGDIGVVEENNHHRQQLEQANSDAAELRERVIQAISDIDGIYWMG